MTTPNRPSLLRRLMAWRARPVQQDPADMGTDIGLEFILAHQPPGGAAQHLAPGKARQWATHTVSTRSGS